jgi:hypothetical protein
MAPSSYSILRSLALASRHEIFNGLLLCELVSIVKVFVASGSIALAVFIIRVAGRVAVNQDLASGDIPHDESHGLNNFVPPGG